MASLGGARRKRALVVVAKTPEIGKVKTRLARTVGDANAFELYEAFLNDIVLRFADGEYDFGLAYVPTDAPFEERGAPCFPQVGATLNERLHNIFKQNASRYPRGTLIMSSDSPHVPITWLERGFALLESADLVLGPACDGGYWIVGMREAHDIFTGIPMSTDQVFRRTVALAEERGLGVALLPETFDVDTADDLNTLRAYLGAHPDAHLPNTRRILSEIYAPRRRTSDT